MEAIFFVFDEHNNDLRKDIFKADEVLAIPSIGHAVSFTHKGFECYSKVIDVIHCFDANAKFSHLAIEIESF